MRSDWGGDQDDSPVPPTIEDLVFIAGCFLIAILVALWLGPA